jgi:hypothetical protein
MKIWPKRHWLAWGVTIAVLVFNALIAFRHLTD